ncbi:MAG: HEAT repeat domain-containing protein [Acidobacteria bacterium]|nr:HEAT repeat domain-containing protein [Acidobacteriota bacterium]
MTLRSLLLLFALALPAAPTAAQTAPPMLPPAAIPAEEAAALAQYWVLLAEEKFEEASRTVAPLLARYPHNVAVLSLVIESDIAHAGATAALTRYETWLGTRSVEEPGILRRLARAALYEWGRQSSDNSARSEALIALVNDGDAAAAAVLAALVQGGQESGLRAGARLQDPNAIDQIAARAKATSGLKLRDIQLLADSGSRRAVPALLVVLADPLPENRAAAADALGRIGGPEVEAALGPALQDEHGLVRISAAKALFRLGNFAGAALLNELAASDSASVRLSAAEMMSTEPDETWKAAVRALLMDLDPLVRLGAARLIAPHDSGAARAVLGPLAYDNNPAIREETELVQAGLPISTFAELRGLLRNGRPLARVRAAARLLELTRLD